MTANPLKAWHPCRGSGYQMINSIDIRNFRCFERLHIDRCQRINVIVGDNGTGKTAFLEAVFMALGGSPELAVRFRQQRGLDGVFSGPSTRIEEALWRDLFYRNDWEHPILIELKGTGTESRSVGVYRGESQLTIPLQADKIQEEIRTAPIVFQWRDSQGKNHTRIPKLTPQGLQVGADQEDLPDFFLFAANQTISSSENAGRFSDLNRARLAKKFIELFTREYKWVELIHIEVQAGLPVLYATLRGTDEMYPLPNVSSGVNRVIGIMLAIASRSRSVVLVDEIENGIYYKHHTAMWRAFLSLARNYEGQLFVTTHNEEWLEALFEAAGEEVADIALWRIERSNKGPVLRQFPGRQTAVAVKAGEVR